MSDMATRLEQVIHDGMVLCAGCEKRYVLIGYCPQCREIHETLERKRETKAVYLEMLHRGECLEAREVTPLIERGDYMPELGWLGYAGGALVVGVCLGLLGLGVVQAARMVTGFLLGVSR